MVTKKLNVAAEVRKALLSGKPLSAQDVIDRWGGSPSAVNILSKQLEKQGYKFIKTRNKGHVFYQLEERVPQPNPAKLGLEVEVKPIPLPTILDTLTVSALAIDRAGKVGMTLRNGKHSWRVIIEGGASK